MKTCFKCNVEKPLRDFYRHPMMGDGRLGKCKECAKKDVRENRVKRIDYYRIVDSARAATPEGRKARREYAKTPAGRRAGNRGKLRWARDNQDKRAAHVILGNAVRDGKLAKLPCSVCGSTKRIHGHHDDYTKPLDVRWLCAKHHSEIHKKQQTN